MDCKKNLKKSGFTLIELVLVIILLAIVGSLSVSLLARSTEIYDFIINRNALMKNLRTMQEFALRDIKNIPAPDSLQSAGDAAFSWKQNADTTMTWAIAGGNLTRAINGTPVTLLDNVVTADSRFRYFTAFSGENIWLDTPGDSLEHIRGIECTIKIQRGDETFRDRRRIYLENGRQAD